eukprot:5279552-Alexandrium_andersonii.AAC.1
MKRVLTRHSVEVQGRRNVLLRERRCASVVETERRGRGRSARQAWKLTDRARAPRNTLCIGACLLYTSDAADDM